MASNKRSGNSEFFRLQQNQLRQAQRDQREAERAAAAAARDERARYLASRRDEAERRTTDVTRWVATLEGLLVEGVRRTARIDLQRFKRTFEPLTFDPGSLATSAQRPEWRQFEPAAPGMMSMLFRGRERHEAAVSRARQRFDDAMASWEEQELDRRQRLGQARAAFDARIARE